MARMAALDRTILRVAIEELRYRDDVPDSVAISEAVEAAGRALRGGVEGVRERDPRADRPGAEARRQTCVGGGSVGSAGWGAGVGGRRPPG